MQVKKIVVLVLAIILLAGGAVNAQPAPYSQGYAEGYLLEVISSPATSLKIEAYDGTLFTLELAPQAVFSIDGIPVGAAAFKPGMEIYASLQGKHITTVEGYASVSPGYISPGSKVRTGVIISIEPEQLELKLPDGHKAVYGFFPGTVVTRGGQAVTLDSLYEGDRVKLFFDSADSAVTTRIQADGYAVEIKGLYKGKLKMADPIGGTVSLDKVQRLQDGVWVDANLPVKIPYNSQNIYSGGRRLEAANLKYYRGKTVYAASRPFFGQEQFNKMVVLNQYESNYQEKIKSLNWYTEALELSNNKNLAFNDGTIIIKSGRLVDKYALNQNADILVVADGRGGAGMADVVCILNENLNNSSLGEHYLYAGRLDQITEDQVELRDFYVLNQQAWESLRRTKTLYYDNDTGIIDLETGQVLSCRQFMSGNYAVDENSDYVCRHNLADWFAYIYTDGDRITAIGVQKQVDSLLSQRATCGTIEKVVEDPLVGWTISLRDARDWSGLRDRWMFKNSSLRLNLGKTVVVKNGLAVQPSDLSLGDRVYLMRDDFNARFVLVK